MNRFGDIDCSFKTLSPVDGFYNEELLSLEQALEGLQSQINDLTKFIKIAVNHCHYPSEHGLTKDESASIYIYTMEWGEQSLYRVLNQALRDENREALKIWFAYLKLFDTALQKLPTVKEILWRGVPEYVGKNFHRDEIVTWWSFNSCSTSLNVITDYLGREKKSTIFLIEGIDGKQISQYTEFRNEEEVILMMGTRFRVKGDPLIATHGRDVVRLVKIDEEEEEEAVASDVSPIQLNPILTVKHPLKSKDHQWKQQATIVAGGNGKGEKLHQPSGPHGICIDQNKSILIADWNNHRIVRWESKMNEGILVTGGNGRNQLYYPTDVIIDKQNHSLIIADSGKRRVVRWLDQNQEILIHNIDCHGLAMDNEGFLYISDVWNHQVQRWKEGQRKETIVAGGNGKGNELNQLDTPSYLFVDDEQSIYVSDQKNHRVMKWRKGAKEGILVAGGNLNQLFSPRGLFVDQWKQIYVVDGGNNRVMRWGEGENEGEIIINGNDQRQEPNQLFFPYGLAFDQEGNLYVADRGTDQIMKFDLIFSSSNSP